MMKLSMIGAAPSVADITSSTTRVGRVDFGTPLLGRPTDDDDAVTAAEVSPTDEPTEPLTDEPGGAPTDGPTDGPAEVTTAQQADQPTEDETPGPALTAVDSLGPHDTLDTLDEETRQAAQSTGEMLEALMELMVKDTAGASAVAPDGDALPDAPPALFDDRVSRSVAEVARSVVDAMHRVSAAHERHVAALELETARRCELLTSQADLDAELIRLHARREAHAIVFAARERTGGADADLEQQGDELGEIGETLSRFAESVETGDAIDTGDTSDTGYAPAPRRLDIPRDV